MDGFCTLHNHHVSPSLSDLESFISTAAAGLSQRVQEGDCGGLVEVMGHLLAVKERQHMTDSMFEPLKQTIGLLKVYEQELPDVVYKQLEVRSRHSVTSPSLYCHAFFLFPPLDVAGTLLFLCAVQLPISSPFSGSWQFIICHSCCCCFSSPPPYRSDPSIHPSVCLHGLQELPEKWSHVHKQATLVKQQVAPLQAIEVASLRRKCALFDVEQHTFRESFRTTGPFR